MHLGGRGVLYAAWFEPVDQSRWFRACRSEPVFLCYIARFALLPSLARVRTWRVEQLKRRLILPPVTLTRIHTPLDLNPAEALCHAGPVLGLDAVLAEEFVDEERLADVGVTDDDDAHGARGNAAADPVGGG